MKLFWSTVTLLALVAHSSPESEAGMDIHEQFFTLASGFWSGVPSATPTGPWTSPLNLTIAKTVPPAGGDPTWVLVHNLDGFAVSNSTQQFWSNYNNLTKTGNLTYCARISSWTKPVSPSMVNLPFQLVSVTNTSIHWTFNNPPYPFTGDWTITLQPAMEGSSSSPRLKSSMTLGGATHFEATLTLQPTKSADDQNIVILDNCPLDVNVTKEKVPKGSTGGRASEKRNRPTCPLGYTKGEPPLFVQEKIRRMQDKQEQRKGSALLRGLSLPSSTASYSAPNGKTYDNCFLVNPAMNLRIRWNWIHGGSSSSRGTIAHENDPTTKKGLLGHINPNSSIEVLVSATVSDSSNYVAIGFYPEWPAMKGMDIALGFVHPTTGEGCVQSLYAKEHLGQPIANDKQKLENATSWVKADPVTGEASLWMQFSRKVDSGYRSLDWWYFPFFNLGEELAFAEGSVFNFKSTSSSTSFCTNAVPSYHGTGKRGVRGFDWGNPQNIPSYMRCDRN